MQDAIVLQGATKSYGDTAALDSVDLCVQQEAFFALLGPNGAGKTTMVKVMTTLARPDAGKVRIAGYDPFDAWEAVQRRIGVVLQENALDPEVTAEEQLIFQGRLFGMSKNEAKTRAAELLEAFALGTDPSPFSEKKVRGEVGKKAKTLSGGNRRRLDCALALVHRPEILFLDEPTTGMDPHARKVFWSAISRLNRSEGVTIFLTTQYLEEAERHAQSMAVVLEGRLRFCGSVAAFKKQVHPDKEQSLEEGYIAFIDHLLEASAGKKTATKAKKKAAKETE